MYNYATHIRRSEGGPGKGERLQPTDEGVSYPGAPCCQQLGCHQDSSIGNLWPPEEGQNHQLPCTEVHLSSGGHIQRSQHTVAQGWFFCSPFLPLLPLILLYFLSPSLPPSSCVTNEGS